MQRNPKTSQIHYHANNCLHSQQIELVFYSTANSFQNAALVCYTNLRPLILAVLAYFHFAFFAWKILNYIIILYELIQMNPIILS